MITVVVKIKSTTMRRAKRWTLLVDHYDRDAVFAFVADHLSRLAGDTQFLSINIHY